MIAAFALALLVAGPAPAVESSFLRLTVETSDDLARYSVAEFSFDLRSANADVLFFFPDAETPQDFRSVQLDGRPLDGSLITTGVQPRFGGKIFILRADLGISTGSHRLQGAIVSAMAAGLPSITIELPDGTPER